MAKREFSAGGIVFRKKTDKLEVLLIKDPFGHWTWPKGHIDKGETFSEAALREIQEETGLRNTHILAKLGRNNYFYRLRGELMFKTVFFFVVETKGEEKLKVQKSEIEDAKWFECNIALKHVDYKGAKEMFKKAIQMYEKEKK